MTGGEGDGGHRPDPDRLLWQAELTGGDPRGGHRRLLGGALSGGGGLRDTSPSGTRGLSLPRRPGISRYGHGLAAKAPFARCLKDPATGIFRNFKKFLPDASGRPGNAAQKERLPKAGSLTGEDCGVACRRLKATWQGLLPFRGRTGNGAVTRRVAGSDVLR